MSKCTKYLAGYDGRCRFCGEKADGHNERAMHQHLKKEKIDAFMDFLHEAGFKRHKNLFAKGFITIRLISHKRRILIMNQDSRVKHQHLCTCLVPSTREECETLFRICEIDKLTNPVSEN